MLSLMYKGHSHTDRKTGFPSLRISSEVPSGKVPSELRRIVGRKEGDRVGIVSMMERWKSWGILGERDLLKRVWARAWQVEI